MEREPDYVITNTPFFPKPKKTKKPRQSATVFKLDDYRKTKKPRR